MTPETRADLVVGHCKHVGVPPRGTVQGGHDYACAPCIAAAIRAASAANPDYRPDHDSLFARFEQLEALIDEGNQRDARELVGLIRAQVLK